MKYNKANNQFHEKPVTDENGAPVLNENGDPYSPRKQGAGLANLYSAINTKAYLSVDGINKTKILAIPTSAVELASQGEYTHLSFQF